MKSFKFIALIMIMLGGFTSIAQKTSSKEVKEGLIQGFASFTESVRPFYIPKDTYKSFERKVLIGDYTTPGVIPTLPPEGANMLMLAYQYLNQGLSYNQIIKRGNFEVMGKATLFVANSAKRSKSHSNAQALLFGGNEGQLNNNPLIQTREGCKWWQLSCHLSSIFGPSGGELILNAIIKLIINLL